MLNSIQFVCKKMFKRWFSLLCISSLFLSATLAHASTEPKPGFTKYYKSAFTRYLDHANRSQSPQAEGLRLQAIGRLLQDNQLEQAEQMLGSMPVQTLPKQLHDEYLILLANLKLLQNKAYVSLNTLHQIAEPSNLLPPQQVAYYHLLAMANAQIKNYLVSAEARMVLDPLVKNTSSQRHNREQTWRALNELTVGELATQIRHTQFGDLQGWLELVYIYKMYKDETALLEGERQQWQQRFARHPANSLLPSQQASIRNFFRAKPTVAVNRGNNPLRVALLLPTSGTHASSANAIKSGFMSGYFEHQHAPNAPADINVYDTVGKDVKLVYKQALNEGANVVIGPLTKQDVAKIEAMGSAVPVPTLGLNFTPQAGKNVANFFEYALSPQDEARQVARKMLQDGALQALVIIPEGAWGKDQLDAFSKTFAQNGGQVVDSAAYKKNTSLDLTIKKLLDINDKTFNVFRQGNAEEDAELPRRTDFDAIFMVADPTTARQVKPLLQFYFANDIPVYATSDVYSGHHNAKLDRDLNGIIFCDIPFSIGNTQKITHAQQQMKQVAPNLSANKTKLFAFGRDAYQLAINLNPFHLSKYHNVEGLTGELYLDNQQILRRLQWAEFKNGVPRPVEG